MPAHVHRDQTKVAREIGIELSAPGEPALGETVDEQDRLSHRVARLDNVKPDATASSNRVVFHNALSTWMIGHVRST